jgi:FAD dependent oxidoreductase
VTCTLSSSHVAFDAIRMENTYMILGHAAGVAVAQALQAGYINVQSIDYTTLSTTLTNEKQVL